MINMIERQANHVNHVILSKYSSSISSTYQAVLSRQRRAARLSITCPDGRTPDFRLRTPDILAGTSSVTIPASGVQSPVSSTHSSPHTAHAAHAALTGKRRVAGGLGYPDLAENGVFSGFLSKRGGWRGAVICETRPKARGSRRPAKAGLRASAPPVAAPLLSCRTFAARPRKDGWVSGSACREDAGGVTLDAVTRGPDFLRRES